jgi:hypothetical protein
LLRYGARLQGKSRALAAYQSSKAGTIRLIFAFKAGNSDSHRLCGQCSVRSSNPNGCAIFTAGLFSNGTRNPPAGTTGMNSFQGRRRRAPARSPLGSFFLTQLGLNRTREGLHFQTLAELETMLKLAGFTGLEIIQEAGRGANVLLVASVAVN